MNKNTVKVLISENEEQITRSITEFEAQFTRLISEILEFGTDEHKKTLRELLQRLSSKFPV